MQLEPRGIHDSEYAVSHGATVMIASDVLASAETTMDDFLAGIERPAFRSAQLALGNADDALDAVQDAMLRLVRSYKQRPAEEWTPLFWSILRRRISDIRRRRKVRSIMVGWLHGRNQGDDGEELPAWDPPAHGPGPSQQLEDQHSMQALAAAVQTLPARQQEAFTLRVLNELSGAETAAAMGCSEGSVKTHLSRAMSAMRQQLEEWR